MNAASAINVRLLFVAHLISLLQYSSVLTDEESTSTRRLTFDGSRSDVNLAEVPISSLRSTQDKWGWMDEILTSAHSNRVGKILSQGTQPREGIGRPFSVHGPLGLTRNAGTCWSAMVRNGNGRCTELLQQKISKEDCCSGRSVTTSWSAEELDSGTLFFWRILGGGVRCSSCRDSCKGVTCEVGKTCVLRKGTPKCVCASKCKVGKSRRKTPVCGTDGRSYRNICRLRKMSCRRKSHSLAVAYKGTCQSSCDKISCPTGKHCLLDQNLMPHCANCLKKCPNKPKRRQVCGADGETYASACHLREKACRKGRAIPLAYKGPCRPHATCTKVRCRQDQSCLKDSKTGMPRCASCSESCLPRNAMRGPICASNNSTYYSWCHMMQDACRQGYVIDTKHAGRCKMTSPKLTKI